MKWTAKSLKPMNEDNVRLHVYMSRCGIGSRRTCERYIDEKRVRVNGAVVTTQGMKVSDRDTILFDGKPIVPVSKKVYIALNKPEGYLCTGKDPENRLCAHVLFENALPETLFHAGRLDMNSSGIIFYTNDGAFAHIVSHPSFGIQKEYVVITSTRIEEEQLLEYKRGLEVSGVHYRCEHYTLINNYKVLLTLVQGKNREIRRVFSHYGIRIKRIHRVRIGCVNLGKLSSGEFRYLKKKEIEWFFERRKV
ncbi:MAG: rRNA pseudouridine synthase [Spirochaetales bacterium]|nr:rRNA pseudouridine synthase [Spirochaetales bacterium]